jgi:hypothetical protein
MGAAGLIILAIPSISLAGVLGFRNDTNATLVIQVMSVVNGIPRREPQVLVPPGKAYNQRVVAGSKQIIIADAKQPTWPLYNGAITLGARDQFFSIQIEVPPPQPNRALRQLPRIKLIATEAPVDGPPKPRSPSSQK